MRLSRPAEPVVEVCDLVMRFGSATVLERLSLEIGHGEFVCVIGRSGCGKTTLLRLIGGLIEPTEGAVKILGNKVTAPGQQSAMVFQADSLFPWKTALDNAAFGLESTGVPRAEARERAQHWLDVVGLGAVGEMKPRRLSGGMRQRVNLARALAVQPAVLLMDEPFASVDYQTREELQLEVMRLTQELASTVMFVTHDVTEAVYLGDRIVVLDPLVHGIKTIVPMHWGRDRALDLKHTAGFAEQCRLVWHSLGHGRATGAIPG